MNGRNGVVTNAADFLERYVTSCLLADRPSTAAMTGPPIPLRTISSSGSTMVNSPVDEVHTEPNQEAHDRTNLEAI